MVQFTRIEIENFFSISDVKLDLKEGVYTLLGANGSGKTSILLAFMQGLYNKNIKTEKLGIDETYNIVTNKPYRIKIWFEIGKDKYLVDNYRAKNNIFIFRNGEDITPKGIKNQLKLIEKIIGLDYKLFSTFFYLSQVTLKSVFDLANEDNLVYRFFDIDTLNLIDKVIKDEINTLDSQIKSNVIIINGIEKQLSILNEFKFENINELLLEKENILEQIEMIEKDTKYKQLDVLKKEFEKIKNKKIELELQKSSLKGELKVLNQQKSQFKDGICPTCKQSVKGIIFDDNQIKNISNQVNKIDDDILALKNKFDNIKRKYQALKEEKEKLLNELNMTLNTINGKINSFNSMKEKYEQVKNQEVSLKKELENIKLQINEFETIKSVLEVSRKVIKSKVILKNYIDNFIRLLNIKINELIELTNFKFSIFVKEHKNKLKFNILKDDELIELDNLSSGEKTRASLIVLFSILEVLQSLAGVKLNILALDEILGVLDKQGVAFLKKILNIYRNEMTIFLIQHHKEIEDNFFDGVIKVKKINNLTILEE